jgi:hypothetical protein
METQVGKLGQGVPHPQDARPPRRPGRKKGGHDAKPRVRRSLGPYKFDNVTAREFLKNIKIGCSVAMAAGVAGVTAETIYVWLRKGKGSKASGSLQKFRRDFTCARHFAGQQDVKTLFAASVRGNVSVAQWRLSRRYPRYFAAPKSKVEFTGAAGGPIETNNRNQPVNMTPAEVNEGLTHIAEMTSAILAAKRLADHEPTAVDVKEEQSGSSLGSASPRAAISSCRRTPGRPGRCDSRREEAFEIVRRPT